MTGDLLISSVSPRLTLHDTDATGSDSDIIFSNGAGQTARIKHQISDGLLPGSGQGILIQDTTGSHTMRLIAGGEIYANGGITDNVSGANKVYHTGNIPTWNQSTTGNAATATKIDSITNSDIVQLTTSQTLSNKTLTSPVINTPTGIVKGDVGLGNVDNTSDANKPVSTAGQTALDGKQTSSTFTSNAYLQNRGTTSQDTVGDGRGATFNYSGSSGNKPTGTDHSLMTMAYSDAWQTQLAQDWRNGGRSYIRGQNNGTWSGWSQLWSSADFANNSSNWNTAYGWGNHASASYATESYVGTQISNLVDSSPEALNTLNELAAALGDDANFSTTVTNSIATKAPLASPSFTGNVGIGTTSPNSTLHVASTSDQFIAKFSHATGTGYAPGSILLQAGQSVSRGQGLFHYNTEADESWFTGVPYSVNSRKWIVANKPDTTFNPDVAQLSYALLTIDSDNGNVGIGTTSPASKLQVALGNHELAIFNNGTNASGIWGMNIGFLSQSTQAQITTPANVPLVFNTGGTRNSMTKGSEWMRITTTGNVGIGKTNPAQKLDVVGNIAASGSISATVLKNATMDSSLTGAGSIMMHPAFNGLGYLIDRGAATITCQIDGQPFILTSSEQKALVDGSYGTSVRFQQLYTPAYNASVTYQIGERVVYNNIIYYCIVSSLGNLPTNTTYWIRPENLAGATYTQLYTTYAQLSFTSATTIVLTIDFGATSHGYECGIGVIFRTDSQYSGGIKIETFNTSWLVLTGGNITDNTFQQRWVYNAGANTTFTKIKYTFTDVNSSSWFAITQLVASGVTFGNFEQVALVKGGGTMYGSVKLNNLTASQTLELDASKNIISAAKQTGYNLALSTTATDIKVNGTQSLGSLSTLARADHVHPTDTSRAPTVSPTFTGTVVLPSGQALVGPEIVDFAGFIGSTSGATKLAATAVAGSTVLTLPAATDILVGRNTADTLTNKILTAPRISSIVNTGTLTLPTSTDTLVGRNTIDTLTNKTLTAPTITGAGAIAGVFTGNITGNVIGNATSATTALTATTAQSAASITATANNTTNETTYITFVDGATGSQGIETDTDLTYNPSTNVLTAGTFAGALSGNAATATKLTSERTIGGVPFDGSANIPQRQATHHSASFTFAVNTKQYIGLLDSDSESTAASNINLPFLAPSSGKLLKIFVRSSNGLTGGDLKLRLEKNALTVFSAATPTVVATSTQLGPTNSAMTTYDFTSLVSPDSGSNTITAGDMIFISIESTAVFTGVKIFFTCLWEWDY
jgi:hypothetical protein